MLTTTGGNATATICGSGDDGAAGGRSAKYLSCSVQRHNVATVERKTTVCIGTIEGLRRSPVGLVSADSETGAGRHDLIDGVRHVTIAATGNRHLFSVRLIAVVCRPASVRGLPLKIQLLTIILVEVILHLEEHRGGGCRRLGHVHLQGDEFFGTSFLRRNRHRRRSHLIRGQRHACAGDGAQRDVIRIGSGPFNLVVFRSHGSGQFADLALLKTDYLTIGIAVNRHGSLYGHAGNIDSERCGDLTISRLHGNSGIAVAGRSDGTVLVNRRDSGVVGRPSQLGTSDHLVLLVVRSCGKRLRIVALKRNSRIRCDNVTVCIRNRNAFNLCAGLVVSNVPRLLSSIAVHLGERPRRTGQQRAVVGAIDLLPFDRRTGLLIDDLAVGQQFVCIRADCTTGTVENVGDVCRSLGSAATSIDLVNVGVLRITFSRTRFL